MASLTWGYGILEIEDAPERTRRQRQTLRSLITEWIRESTPDMRCWFIKQSTGGPCLGAVQICVALVVDNFESVGNIDSIKGALEACTPAVREAGEVLVWRGLLLHQVPCQGPCRASEGGRREFLAWSCIALSHSCHGRSLRFTESHSEGSRNCPWSGTLVECIQFLSVWLLLLDNLGDPVTSCI